MNSPVRAFKSVGGGPIVFDKVKDAYCSDVDGNKYVAYVGSWGPAICGHSNDQVNAALKAQIDKGSSFGAPCELENVLGQMVIDRVPSVEMVRFCNSGTEACLSVLRVMRAYTGRDKLINLLAFAALALWPRALATASDIDPICTGVVEDNARGVDSARAAGCPVLQVQSVADVTYGNLANALRLAAEGRL